MNPAQFVEALSKLKFESSFNPYSNRCVVHDLDDAPQRRLQTLLTVLETATKPFSNRSHNSLERRTGEELLSQLILLLKPRRLVAIGNDAARTVHRLKCQHRIIQVRHPSYGGQTQFLTQMCNLYNLQLDLFQSPH